MCYASEVRHFLSIAQSRKPSFFNSENAIDLQRKKRKSEDDDDDCDQEEEVTIRDMVSKRQAIYINVLVFYFSFYVDNLRLSLFTF